ncbi:hypothetical protein [Novosphingobium aerophilum]|uniref:DUF2946 domain-containing protein n=1 Tax=Novosphingobium aerophilum TaxID=2839843 RepID=A0A7X1F8Z6_9SPHN|nr:hypothetical protein [Novosphingobium aerophilum]MBC2652630.1 hypothetical protein [Novosphingobium aerophilum]
MFRHLLAFLLIFGLALPAMAAPLHCATMAQPAAMTAHHRHGDHHQQAPQAPAKAAPMQDCLGCAALREPLPPPAGLVALPALPLIAPRLAAMVGHRPAPETPPPRPLS